MSRFMRQFMSKIMRQFMSKFMRKRKPSSSVICFPAACLSVAFFAFFAFFACAATGCAKTDSSEDSAKVFYLNSDRTGITSTMYKPSAVSVEGLAGELLEQMTLDFPESGLTAPIRGFKVKDFSIQKSTISIDFTSGYKKQEMIREKLVRAAIVNTMCGIEEIRRVTIRVNGALLVDARGAKSENMTSDQFIYNSGSEMLNFERTEMHLYFASEDGKKLVDTYRTVVYNGNIPMERLVAEQIIKGPKGDFNYPTINPETKVVNILTRDNICTITFDKTFLTNTFPVEAEVAIYSIVNSLTELPSIRQVQILIDGEEHPVFMDHYSLDSENLLQKNTKLIKTKE